MTSEIEPFLSDGKQSQELEGHYIIKKPSPRKFPYAVLIHVSVIVAYTMLFAFMVQELKPKPSTSLHRKLSFLRSKYRAHRLLLTAIANLMVSYVPVTYTDFEESAFAGPPSPSVDKAWHDLLEKTTIRVAGEELKRSNQSSVALPAGGGYMAWLGVYHQLHCIVRRTANETSPSKD